MSKQVIGDNQPWLINPILIALGHSVRHYKQNIEQGNDFPVLIVSPPVCILYRILFSRCPSPPCRLRDPINVYILYCVGM